MDIKKKSYKKIARQEILFFQRKSYIKKLFSISLAAFLFVFPSESLNSSSRVHKFLFTGEKWVAFGTDFYPKILFSRPCLNNFSTSTGYYGVLIFRVNSFFQSLLLFNLDRRCFLTLSLRDINSPPASPYLQY